MKPVLRFNLDQVASTPDAATIYARREEFADKLLSMAQANPQALLDLHAVELDVLARVLPQLPTTLHGALGSLLRIRAATLLLNRLELNRFTSYILVIFPTDPPAALRLAADLVRTLNLPFSDSTLDFGALVLAN